MEWTREGDRWRSGPYLIESIGPHRWVLTRDTGDDAQSLVRAESEWTGRTLTVVKQMADSIEEHEERARRFRKRTAVFAGLLAVFIAAVAGTTPMAGLVATASFLGALIALMNMIGNSRLRDWASTPPMYQ